MMEYYNSIQDGACCKDCFIEFVEKESKAGNLIALSERFRTNADMICRMVSDHLSDGIKDPFIEDEYIDRVIVKVPLGDLSDDPRYEGTRELFILSASLNKSDCFCSR